MRGSAFHFDWREASGALGDLGTLLPLMLGTIVVVGLAPKPVLIGFAIAYIATALWYRLPVPVQPMKAVAAVALTVEMTAASLAASGVMIGLVLLVLGTTGWIDKLARLVPQSLLAGLQLGLGIGLGWVALQMMSSAPVLGILLGGGLLLLLRFPRLPAALSIVALALLAGQFFDVPRLSLPVDATGDFIAMSLPSIAEIQQSFSLLVLPQLALTLTNAVILTALICGDYFGESARHVTPRRLSISSGLGNCLLTPLGALPMCHGAGGVAAHYRFGARSGGAPLMLGGMLLLIAVLPAHAGLGLLAAIPLAGLGVLLMAAAIELAWSRRLVDCNPSCYPVIGVTAAATVLVNPFIALVCGTLAEILRRGVIRLWLMRADH